MEFLKKIKNILYLEIDVITLKRIGTKIHFWLSQHISRGHKIHISSLYGYSIVISIFLLLISINALNFTICLYKNYAGVNMLISRNIENNGVFASFKQVEYIISSNLEINLGEENTENITSIKSKNIIVSKMKYTQILREKFQDKIDAIPNAKKERVLSKVSKYIAMVEEKNVGGGEGLDDTLGKILAIQSILSDSLNEEIKLESAAEKEIQEKSVAERNKTTEGKANSNLNKILQEKNLSNKIEKEAVTVKIKPNNTGEISQKENNDTTPAHDVSQIAEKKTQTPVVIIIEEKTSTQDTIEEISIEPQIKQVEIQKTVVKKTISTVSDPIAKSINNTIESTLTQLGGTIFSEFKNKTLKKRNMFLENGIWYTYVYHTYKGFGKGVIPSKSDLENGGLDKASTLLLVTDSEMFFVTDYKKVKLINNSIINNITNKESFLHELIDDKKYLHNDTDKELKDLKQITINLTKGLSDGQKISKIYGYILGHVSYTTNFNINNKDIFSGTGTYRNKVGACEGYSKMFLYMLSFAGVSNVSLMRGHVIDAPDFPHIGHAWVRVGHLYYDPTFDDPIGLSKPRTYNTYRYFGLPKDLFYTNRFNYGSLPQHLKNGSLETRKDYINKELSKLATKYKNSKYLLLKPFVFKSSNNIALNLHINIETLKQILPYKEVYDYEFLEDGEQKTISNIDYYTVNDENIEILLEQLNYNLSGYYLFKWDNESYRLAYNVVF